MKTKLSKAFVLLLALVMLVTQVVAPVYAIETTNQCVCPEDGRTGEFVEHVEATCSEYAYDVFKCDACGGEYSVLTDEPTGQHDYEIFPAQEQTCEEIGWEEYGICKDCGYSTYVELPKLGHDYDEKVTDPTCTDKGYTTYTCKRDSSHTYDDNFVDALGHDYKEINKVDPTCVEDGYTEYECSVCNDIKKEPIACVGKHDYDKTVVAPTCTEAEKITYICKVETCKYTFTEEGEPALGHTEVIDDAVEPTCTETGLTEGKHCDVCGEVLVAQKVVDALGHKRAEAVEENRIEPDCENTGSVDKVVYCSVCNAELSRVNEEIPALGHTYPTKPVEENRVEPDCENDGGYDLVENCTVCGEELSRTHEVIKTEGHKYVAVVTPPSCSADGFTTYTCSVCDDSYTDNIVPKDPLSHRTVISKDAVEATCTSTGLTREVVCGDCGVILGAQKVTEINPDNHDYKAVVTEPTCTEGGFTTYTCSRCNDFYIDDVKQPLGHTEGTPVVENNVAPDCTNDGSYDSVVYCTVCDAELSRTNVTVDALKHDLVYVDAKGPTCTENGNPAYEYCKREGCGYSTEKAIPPLGHDYVAVVTDPTCTEGGYTTYTCSRCSDSYIDDETEATGHDTWETIGDVHQNTCTEKGYTVKKCLVCEEIFKDDWVDELGHDLVYVDAKEPTCTEIGWEAYEYCKREGCDHTTYKEIEAKGHALYDVEGQEPTCDVIGWDPYKACEDCDYTEGYVELTRAHMISKYDHKKATCTEIGWEEYECCDYDDCDYTTYVELPALGHDLEYVDAKAPTCTENGHPAYEYCKREGCGYSTEKAIPPTGHTEVIDEAVEPTFDTTGLTEGKHCGVCGEVIVPQTVVDRIKEEIVFSYEATGINGYKVTANSSYVTLKVYMDVNSAIARLWGVDLGIKFNENLTLVGVDGCIFEQNLSTPLDIANGTKLVKLTQDMGFSTAKTFENGQYLFATLTFKVDKDFYSEDVKFEVVLDECEIGRDSEVLLNELVPNFGTGTEIHVNMLGDANLDGEITVEDTLAFSKSFMGNEDYTVIYDLDKDGFVTVEDFKLLRGAVVFDDSYLEI